MAKKKVVRKKTSAKKSSPKKMTTKKSTTKKSLPKKAAKKSTKKSSPKKSTATKKSKVAAKKSLTKIPSKKSAKKSSSKKSIPKKSTAKKKTSTRRPKGPDFRFPGVQTLVNSMRDNSAEWGEYVGKHLVKRKPDLEAALKLSKKDAANLRRKKQVRLRDFPMPKRGMKHIGQKLAFIEEHGEDIDTLLGKNESWALKFQGGESYEVFGTIGSLIEKLENYNIINGIANDTSSRANNIYDDIVVMKVQDKEIIPRLRRIERNKETRKERNARIKKSFKEKDKQIRSQQRDSKKKDTRIAKLEAELAKLKRKK